MCQAILKTINFQYQHSPLNSTLQKISLIQCASASNLWQKIYLQFLNMFSGFTSVMILIVVFKVTSQSNLVGSYHCCSVTCCLHFSCRRWRQQIHHKCWWPPT